jgi:predicted transcriptional regulator of viral defense system
MIKPHIQVMEELAEYSSPKSKLSRMIKAGEIIQLKRGLFLSTEDRSYSAKSLSSLIYGPSYISFECALAYYDLIPERVESITCAVFNKNKNRSYHTPAGDYYYHYIPAVVFPYETLLSSENNQNFLIASPEKAICDTLYKERGISNVAELLAILTEGWRIDLDHINNLSAASFRFLLPLYRKKACNLFLDFLTKEGLL